MSATHNRLGAGGLELPVDQVSGPGGSGVGDGGEHRFAALHAAQAGLAHQAAGSVRGLGPAAPCHRPMHLLDPVHRVVLPMHLAQVGDQLFVADYRDLTAGGSGRLGSPAR